MTFSNTYPKRYGGGQQQGKTEMSKTNFTQKPVMDRLKNVSYTHQRNVLNWLCKNKVSRVVNGCMNEDAAHKKYGNTNDYVIPDHLLITNLAEYWMSTLETAYEKIREEYHNNPNGRFYNKGRPNGSKNRPKSGTLREITNFNALEVLKDLSDTEVMSDEELNNELFGGNNEKVIDTNQLIELPTTNSDDNKRQIAELFSQFIENYSKDLILIKSENKSQIDNWAATLSEKIKQEIKQAQPNIIEIKRAELPNINMGVQHHNFEKLLRMCTATTRGGNHLNVWLYGPPGTGKSTAAEKVAEALGREFLFDGKMGDTVQVLGYQDAGGNYKTTNFRKAYEFGGVYLADEIDGSSPDALIALNAALANGHCNFPDKMVKRHKDFIFIAAANTTGTGGTVEYVGRFKQDAAFNDRFVFLDWPIDEALEDALVADKAWLGYVRHVRSRVTKSTIKGHLITPRASIYGEALIAAGVELGDVIEQTLKKGLTSTQWDMIK